MRRGSRKRTREEKKGSLKSRAEKDPRLLKKDHGRKILHWPPLTKIKRSLKHQAKRGINSKNSNCSRVVCATAHQAQPRLNLLRNME